MMISNPFSINSHSNSTDLANEILSANSLSQISAAITAVESHLHSYSSDQSRLFFSTAFPALICKLFGFNDSPTPAGWIESVSTANDSELSGKLFNLLSPKGVLMNSISDVDRLGLVKYVFPSERLPELIRLVISAESDCDFVSELCPMLKGRIHRDQSKGKFLFQVQLNVFEYYVFWFAYYPTSKRSSENLGLVSAPKTRKFGLENWTSSLPVFLASNRCESEQKNECSMYMRLLYAYLRAFVPMYDASAYQPYCSPLLQYCKDADDSVVSRAEFFVSGLLHYWLVGNDASTLPMSVRNSISLAAPLCSIPSDIPPVDGLGELVSLFVKYLNICSITERSESGLKDVMNSLKVTSASRSLPSPVPWNLRVQRPLYRFILNTFLSFRVGSSMKNVSGVVSIWVAYLEPWKLSKEEFLELDSVVGSSNTPEKHHGGSKDLKYSSIWQDYVLSNYLYYTMLVMHFIGFAHKYLHTDPEVMVQMVVKVMNVLNCSRELLELMKNVDTILYSRQPGSCNSTPHTLYESVVPIREQLLDWEDGLYESDLNKNRRLFSDGEDGGQQLLQLFVLRAESELQTLSANPSSLESIGSLKSQICCLFGDHALKPTLNTPERIPFQQSRVEIFMPRRSSNCILYGPKYKGDWMKRPISNDEVAWLAQLLIHFSSWLNETLGLNPVCLHENPNWSYVDTDQHDDEHGPGEASKIIPMLQSAMATLMIKHGMKVNLRIFASKKFIMLVLLLSLCSFLKKSLRP